MRLGQAELSNVKINTKTKTSLAHWSEAYLKINFFEDDELC